MSATSKYEFVNLTIVKDERVVYEIPIKLHWLNSAKVVLQTQWINSAHEILMKLSFRYLNSLMSTHGDK